MMPEGTESRGDVALVAEVLQEVHRVRVGTSNCVSLLLYLKRDVEILPYTKHKVVTCSHWMVV